MRNLPVMETTPQSTCGAVGALCLQVILLGRIAGKVSDYCMDIFQIKHFKDGVGGLAVLPLDDGVPDAHLLGGHIILENGLAVQTNPRISRAGNRNLDV